MQRPCLQPRFSDSSGGSQRLWLRHREHNCVCAPFQPAGDSGAFTPSASLGTWASAPLRPLVPGWADLPRLPSNGGRTGEGNISGETHFAGQCPPCIRRAARPSARSRKLIEGKQFDEPSVRTQTGVIEFTCRAKLLSLSTHSNEPRESEAPVSVDAHLAGTQSADRPLGRGDLDN